MVDAMKPPHRFPLFWAFAALVVLGLLGRALGYLPPESMAMTWAIIAGLSLWSTIEGRSRQSELWPANAAVTLMAALMAVAT